VGEQQALGGGSVSLRCAIYARYSSDQQSPLSLDDQIRKCREYAQGQGWEVLEEYIFTDAEISAAGSDRPGLKQFLACVQSKPRPFDVLLIDDTSRLSRRQADQSNIVEQLRFAGYRFVAVSQGIDSISEQSDVLMTVHGLVDSLYIKELAKKTHRGLEGQIERGFHAGGRCFGYQNETVEGAGSRRVIDPEQAKVVVRIFEMSAGGLSLKKIAKKLNDEGVPTSRPRAGKQYASWCPTALRAMLRNELYIGRVIWNRRQFVKRPGTNKRVPRDRPKSEWSRKDLPELRIVPDELWRRVQERQELLKTVYGRAGRGINKASSSPNLLTGLLKCGTCGANMTIVMGGWKKWSHPYYGCPQNFNRSACSNGLKIRKEIIERNLFGRLQAEVLTDEVIQYTIQEFTRRNRDDAERISEETALLQRRQRELEQELGRVAAAIAQTGHSRFLLDAITERERELDILAQKLQSAGRGTVETHPGNVREFVLAGLKDLMGLLRSDTTRARAELAKYTSEIRLFPERNETGAMVYYAEGIWDLFGTYQFALVAGEGFEPSTFGL
jgi:site-specific DNA recombinase